jgi:magnesium transporter
MQTLTTLSVFFMPLTFIVGLYGMNFKLMPELEWKYGYPFVIGLMAVVCVLIYVWFKKRGWFNTD